MNQLAASLQVRPKRQRMEEVVGNLARLALYTLDVKDAFLLMDQPEDEWAMIITENGQYKLKKNLPGQRNAAAQWFKGFCKVAREYGLVQDVT